VRLDNGSFVDLTEQIEAIEARTKLDEMRVIRFMDAGQIQRERVVASYYIGAADNAAPRPLRMLYEAMRAKRRVAIVKLTKRSRQTLGVITAHGRTKTLVLNEMIWMEDFREPPPKALAIREAVVTEREVRACCKLIEAMSDTREALDELRDDAIALREELRARAEAGEMDVTVVEPVPVADAQEDLEAALEASLAAVRAA
jgi:DNA end-binding protein Ku